MDHRQLEALGGLPDHGLADVEQGADLGDVHPVQVGHRVEAGQPPLVEQGQEEGLHRVVVVVPQGHLVDARLPQGGVEGAPAHLGAQGAGVLLLPGFKDHVVHLGGDPVEGDALPPAPVRHGGQVHPRDAHVHGEGLHREPPGVEPGQPGQPGQEEEGVLPPGHPHPHPLSGGNHLVILHAPAEETEDLLHGWYTPCAQKMKLRYEISRDRKRFREKTRVLPGIN